MDSRFMNRGFRVLQLDTHDTLDVVEVAFFEVLIAFELRELNVHSNGFVARCWRTAIVRVLVEHEQFFSGPSVVGCVEEFPHSVAGLSEQIERQALLGLTKQIQLVCVPTNFDRHGCSFVGKAKVFNAVHFYERRALIGAGIDEQGVKQS